MAKKKSNPEDFQLEVFDVEQGTPEWFQARKGVLTASCAQEIGNNGKGLETYVLEKIAEQFSSAVPVMFENDDTKRGKDLEAQARIIYELEKDVSVKTIGFIKIKGRRIGCSPDGLIKEEGMCEIKAHNDKNHLLLILQGQKAVPSKYLWQMQMQMYITGRKWCDYVAYNPNFKKNILVFRVTPDKEMQIELFKGFQRGEELLKELETKLNE